MSSVLATTDLTQVKQSFSNGDIFAYPTEAVYGIGCDPLNREAVEKILEIKKRPIEKGMILIASDLGQVEGFIDKDALTSQQWQPILASWPGQVTWLLPKSKDAPFWVTGESEYIAVRVTAHPVCRALCDALDSPLVSTSANPAGDEPARTPAALEEYFGSTLTVVSGELGGATKPSQIRHGRTGDIIRAG